MICSTNADCRRSAATTFGSGGRIFLFRHGACRVMLLMLLAACGAQTAPAQTLELRRGDRICLVGNALGERMQHRNWWETLLYQQFPQHELVVRNLCFPGDEPLMRIRSKNFGDPDQHLAHSKASVVLYFFGFNESFAGDAGIGKFSRDIRQVVEHTKQQSYDGERPPRVVLVSPIAFENTGDPNLPDGAEHNARLEKYTAAMQKVASETGVGFVDLFHPTRELFQQSDERLTLNGAHLNDDGYRALAPVFMEGLFGKSPTSFDERLRQAIADKNFHWWHRYRAVNGFSIYGDRGKAGSDGTYNNTDVMERERAILDQMTANRDQRIWALAQGQSVPEKVDDSNTLPFITPKTNVGIPNDPNRARGKLGSLDYLPAAEQQKKFKLAPGYEINLVASEEQFPELANPVALAFDNQGRLWVATMQSYPQWKPKTKLDDKLLIFEDYDRDGRADECKVFAGGLHQPTGFELGRGGVFVAQQPDILFLKDTDGDDRADVRIRQLIGFDSADSHHGIAAFEWGPGGQLYFQEGTFKYSQVESPYGLTRLNEAGVWRYDPRTEKFGVHVSFAFANPWGHAFDRWGQDFIGDASPGFSYWAAPISGFIEYPQKHPGGAQHRRVAAQAGGDPKYRFPTFYPKRTRPLAGCTILSSRHFPPEVQGNWLVTNCIGDRALLNHEVREEGSGFVGKEVTPIVSCDDGNFRPVDVEIAPDGSIYIVDWHNALIGHLQHNLREPHRDHSHGRIWRITYKGRPLIDPPKIAGETIPALLELLKVTDDRTRYRVRRELADRPTADVVRELDRWIERLNPEDVDYEHHLLEALWMFQTHNIVRHDLLDRMLHARDHRARAAAVRVLSFWLERVPDRLSALQAAVNDAHPRVRLEAVRALSFLAKSPDRLQALNIALDVLEHETDHYLEYTLQETLRVLDPLAEVGSHAMAHDHGAHGAGGAEMNAAMKPVVFLEKSPRAVAFQLARLDNAQLLLVERDAEQPKFAPVYAAILTRPGMARQDRREALQTLVKLKDSNPVSVLLGALATVETDSRQGQRTSRQLATLLLTLPTSSLQSHVGEISEAVKSRSSFVRAVAFAALIAAGESSAAREHARGSARLTADWMRGTALLPTVEQRNRERDAVVAALSKTKATSVLRAGIATLGTMSAHADDTFRRVAPFVESPALRAVAVRTLLRVPDSARQPDVARRLARQLVELAEATPAAKRTTNEFLDAMQLADQLIGRLTAAEAKELRMRLRAVTVRVVRIHTVEEEMRYDTKYFAVEAGRPVQVVLQNEDLMPHNLVITVPGALQEVAELGAQLGPNPGFQGKPYVPKSEKVLFATDMVQPEQQYRLTFTAPAEPGEYPFVCTFPRHWMRMYGVMVVVPDLDEWMKNPVEPKDPIGSNRAFVKAWTMDDFRGSVAKGLEGRSLEIGRRIFEEATCAQCHKADGSGGAVGPELNGVLKRWKNDPEVVLQQILEPSHTIEPKYAVYLIRTTSGQVISGIIQSQTPSTISVLVNPESKEPMVLKRSDIDEMVKTSTSMMPKALLDRFSKDEILELLSYITSLPERPAAPASQ